MENSALPLVLLSCCLAGVGSHLFYFIRGEHHRQVQSIAILVVLIPVVFTALQVQFLDVPVRLAYRLAFLTGSAYAIGLFSSITLYRAFFHPLRHFEGPVSMRITKLAHVLRSRKLDNYLQLDELRRHYGEFVRTGPNELTIFRPDAHTAIHGPTSKCKKAAWYDMMYPTVSLQTTRDKADHNRRRRIWDRAFSVKATNGYHPRVVTHLDAFERKLLNEQNTAIDVTNWFNFVIFDIMGDVSFGTEFNLVKTGKMHFAIEKMRAGMVSVGILSPVPWLFRIIASIPGAMRPWHQLVGWCNDEALRRLKNEPELPDIFAWLIDAVDKTASTEEKAEALVGDTLLAILAGSETTATALIFLFYHLVLDPSHVDKIRKELDGVDDIRSNDALQALPYLNGAISEALRLHPPAPAGLLRQTPPEGISIGGTYIPGDVTCLSPIYSIARLESCFERPDEFIPERWSTAGHLIKDKTGYAPFSLGMYNCIGRNLALMEIRILTAMLLTRFDVGFAPGENGEELFSRFHDHFSAAPGPLRLTFMER